MAEQTFGVPTQVMAPTGPTVPWVGALVVKAVTSSPSGSLADSVTTTGVSSSVSSDVSAAVGGSCVSVTVISKSCSTFRAGVPLSVARTRIE